MRDASIVSGQRCMKKKKLLETLQNQEELEGTAPDKVMLPPSEK